MVDYGYAGGAPRPLNPVGAFGYQRGRVRNHQMPVAATAQGTDFGLRSAQAEGEVKNG